MARLSQHDEVARQAIEWMVLLRSGEASTHDYEHYLRWRHAEPAHDSACLRIEQTLGQFTPLLEGMPTEPIRQALLAPSSRRKAIQYGLGMAATLTLSTALLNQRYPLTPAFADMKTMTAERRSLTLVDGSELTLDARSAVNINVADSNAVREVALLSGGLLLRATENAQRPVLIKTRVGELLALGGRMNVRYEDGGVHVGVLDSVAKLNRHHGHGLVLQPGQGAWFDDRTLLQVAIRPEAETAWTHGRLEVYDRTLGSVVRTLRNYSPGVIRIDPEVAGLRVSGNFPLDNIHSALDSLAQTMPIAVVHTTRYWIQIQPASYRRNA
ncbi:FecR family protein [Klebsiella oxytoca]|uniref:FecR family protein n=1 Tax=Klebsiella oxytoca TaxID=571 RepID=UPI002930460B|nr:FecR domain-containing protein [Klebsiella oxytoca]